MRFTTSRGNGTLLRFKLIRVGQNKLFKIESDIGLAGRAYRRLFIPHDTVPAFILLFSNFPSCANDSHRYMRAISQIFRYLLTPCLERNDNLILLSTLYIDFSTAILIHK